ncbi:hydantoinase/oxoprolinase family protein [Rhodococcus erythropolis]
MVHPSDIDDPTLVSVDVGGTFTDVVSVRNGSIMTTKVPTDLIDTAAGVLEGAAAVGVSDAVVFNHASTAGLNALLTRSLPKIGLLTTEGYRDVLDIGHSWRPHEALLNPRWRRSFGDANAPIVPRYLRRTISERIMADGSIFQVLDEVKARKQIQVLKRSNVEGIAICLTNAWANDAHERRLAEIVREELGDVRIVVSHQVSPTAREYPRMSTTVVDTLMGIIYGDYSERLAKGLAELSFSGALNFGDCAAMLAPFDVALKRPSRVIFSGPAAGTTASAHFGRMIERRNLICVDVGGTSTDVSIVVDGRAIVETSLELEHDLIVSTMSNEIASVGAGGGSIVWAGPNGEIQVGPRSSGSDPGPACYGRGGIEPTMSDACLLMGILDPTHFLGGERLLDTDAARRAFESLDTPLSFDQRVHDAFQIGLHNIAEGVLDIVIRNGVDPRDFSLVAFGAAGPMLLPSLIPLINVREVIVPPHPGLFSAIGLLSADMVFMESRTLMVPLVASSAGAIEAAFEELTRAVEVQVGAGATVTFDRSFDARMVGQAFETPFVEMPPGPVDTSLVGQMLNKFHDVYQARSGNRFEEMAVETVNLRVRAVVEMPKVKFPEIANGNSNHDSTSRTTRQMNHVSGGSRQATIFDRESLLAGARVEGPAVIHERLSTTFVPPDHSALVGSYGEFIITRS